MAEHRIKGAGVHKSFLVSGPPKLPKVTVEEEVVAQASVPPNEFGEKWRTALLSERNVRDIIADLAERINCDVSLTTKPEQLLPPGVQQGDFVQDANSLALFQVDFPASEGGAAHLWRHHRGMPITLGSPREWAEAYATPFQLVHRAADRLSK